MPGCTKALRLQTFPHGYFATAPAQTGVPIQKDLILFFFFFMLHSPHSLPPLEALWGKHGDGFAQRLLKEPEGLL